MGLSNLQIEIAVTLLALLVLVLGLLLPRSAPRISGKITLIGVIAILVMTIISFSDHPGYIGNIYINDTFALFFKILFLIAALIVLLGSQEYVKRWSGRGSEFYAFMLFATLGMILLASAGDFIVLYLALELMTISFYVLTAFLIDDKLSTEAGLKYLILGALSSAILLFGISLAFGLTGTTVISEVLAPAGHFQPAMLAGLIMMLVGFAFKLSIMPFHMWAPDIYQGAPVPVATYLAVASKAAAFAVTVRVFLLVLPTGSIIAFNWTLLLAILAAVTIVAGNLIALAQTNTKRLLAYSSIAQAGYILAGLVAANTYGMRGLLFYSFLYVFSNAGAFTVATIVEVDSGSTELQSLSGLGRRSPVLAAIMTVCLLSLAGIPPLAGFVGKLYLFTGVVQEGYLWLAFIALIMSMVSAYYYLNVAKIMYADEPLTNNGVKISWLVKLALWICLLGTIFIGVYPAPLADIAGQALTSFSFLGL